MLAQGPYIYLSSVSSGIYLYVHTQCARLPSLSLYWNPADFLLPTRSCLDLLVLFALGIFLVSPLSSTQCEVYLNNSYSVGLYAYLPHSMPLKARWPSPISCIPDIGALVKADSNLLVFPANTPCTQLTQWQAVCRRFYHWAWYLSNDFFFSWKKLINKIS